MEGFPTHPTRASMEKGRKTETMMIFIFEWRTSNRIQDYERQTKKQNVGENGSYDAMAVIF